MPDINPSIPIVGQPDSTEEPKIVTALSQLVAAVDNVDTDQIADGTIAPVDLSASLLDSLGVTSGGISRRGKSIIPGTDVRSSTAYGLMTTPDKVTVALPTDGLIAVAFQGMWQSSIAQAGRAAIFIGANQLKVQQANIAGPVVQEAAVDGAAATDVPLSSGSGGLVGHGSAGGATGAGADVTTGQVVGNASYEYAIAGGGTGVLAPRAPAGGFCYIFAAAGTYDVSVQFKATSGSVTVKNRRLWVMALGF